MAGKFVIYCDEGPTNSTKAGPEEKQIALNQPVKREPLGLRQTISQTTAAIPSASSSFKDEDQENDISMASLGSDFAPSISNDFDDSYDDVTDDDFDADEELQFELNLALKQHDEAQLFKSAIYNHDIEDYLHQLERKLELRPIPNYMDSHQFIDSSKRTILIDWLVLVADEYNLQPETLFISTNIVDRYLSNDIVLNDKDKTKCLKTDRLQLLGVTAMFTASKYEEIYPPSLDQFVDITDATYSGKQIIEMEQEILRSLSFRISQPTISYFLKQVFAFNKFSKEVYHLAEYLCYLSLLDDRPFLEYYPSEIALASVILAANQLNAHSSILPELRSSYDKSNLDQFRRRTEGRKVPFCIEALRAMQRRASNSSIHTKFAQPSHNCVSLLQPPEVDNFSSY